MYDSRGWAAYRSPHYGGFNYGTLRRTRGREYGPRMSRHLVNAELIFPIYPS